MLKTSINATEFYNAYVATIHELYSDSYIKQNHLEPSNETSFKRSMSRKANVSLEQRDDKSYTPADMQAIVNDTNAKYEEYATGNYTSELRRKGEGRYALFSKVFEAVLKRLGYPEIAEGLKYVDNADGDMPKVEEVKAPEPKTDEKVLEEALDIAKRDAGLGENKDEKEEEKNEEPANELKLDVYDLDANVAILEMSEGKIDEKIAEYQIKKNLTDKDKEHLEAVVHKLEDVIINAKRFIDNADSVDENIKKLIDKGEWQIDKLYNMIDDDSDNNGEATDADIQRLKAHFDGDEEKEEEITVAKNPFKNTSKNDSVDIEALIPSVLEAIPKFLQKGHEAAEENDKLKAEIESLKAANDELTKQLDEVKNKSTLPTNEDELVKLAKEVVNKIDDKSKLKDIGMVIMMKAL